MASGEPSPSEPSDPLPLEPAQLSIEIHDATRRLTPDQVEWLANHAHKAAGRLGAAGSVRVRVVDDAEMSAAHAEFLEDPTTTDVLTFDMSEGLEDVAPPSAESVRLGTRPILFVLDTDILACVDVASRQAASRGYSVEKELLLYVVHGMLHCMGHDDHDEDASAAMHGVEDAVLEAIGVGRAFAAPRADGQA